MPGYFLHVDAAANCSHGGRATPAAVNPRVLVMGRPTVTLAASYVIAGCAWPPPPTANGPCTSARFITGSARVVSLGRPLLLDTSQAICAPTGAPLLITSTQTRVLGM